MKLTLTMDMDNAAFDESGEEARRILISTARRIEDGHTSGFLMDYNGNSVGHWEIEGSRPADTEDLDTEEGE